MPRTARASQGGVCYHVINREMVSRAREWRWSSLSWWRSRKRPEFLHATEWVTRKDWATMVDAPQTDKELESLRRSVTRGMPYGEPSWTGRSAVKLGLEFTLRSVGRPRKNAKK